MGGQDCSGNAIKKCIQYINISSFWFSEGFPYSWMQRLQSLMKPVKGICLLFKSSKRVSKNSTRRYQNSITSSCLCELPLTKWKRRVHWWITRLGNRKICASVSVWEEFLALDLCIFSLQISKAEFDLVQSVQENANLRSQIVQSPDKLQVCFCFY